jgi:hypothetical protein
MYLEMLSLDREKERELVMNILNHKVKSEMVNNKNHVYIHLHKCPRSLIRLHTNELNAR